MQRGLHPEPERRPAARLRRGPPRGPQRAAGRAGPAGLRGQAGQHHDLQDRQAGPDQRPRREGHGPRGVRLRRQQRPDQLGVERA